MYGPFYEFIPLVILAIVIWFFYAMFRDRP